MDRSKIELCLQVGRVPNEKEDRAVKHQRKVPTPPTSCKASSSLRSRYLALITMDGHKILEAPLLTRTFPSEVEVLTQLRFAWTTAMRTWLTRVILESSVSEDEELLQKKYLQEGDAVLSYLVNLERRQRTTRLRIEQALSTPISPGLLPELMGHASSHPNDPATLLYRLLREQCHHVAHSNSLRALA